MGNLLLENGLPYNSGGDLSGAQTERRGGAGPVGACLAVRTSPAAFVFPTEFRLLLLQPQHSFRFRSDAAELFRPDGYHLYGLVIPGPCLTLVSHPPVNHGQPEPLPGVSLAACGPLQ